MNANKLLSALSYFSMFFAPFLFPILVYFLGEKSVKAYAKNALWMHIVTYASIFIGLGLGGYLTRTVDLVFVGLSVMMLFVLVSGFYFVWNIVKGVQVLTHSS